MTEYKIVCRDLAKGDAFIEYVGVTWGGSIQLKLFSTKDVDKMIGEGDKFFVEVGGKKTYVHGYKDFISTNPDNTTYNNLRNLKSCK